MQHPYKVNLTHKAKTGLFPALKGELLENGIIIAKFSRGSTRNHFVPPITYKFLSDRARNRFDNFADCLSIEESIEALIP
jgi:hypothetical protein